MTVTTLFRLLTTSSKVVFVTGAPASVKAVRVFVNDAACALPDQFGVSAESIIASIIVVSESSSDSLEEALVDAAAHATPSPSRKSPTSVGSG